MFNECFSCIIEICTGHQKRCIRSKQQSKSLASGCKIRFRCCRSNVRSADTSY